MIETFLVVSLMGFALLWHAASTVSGQQLLRAEGTHGVALQTTRAFIERLRTDASWDTLYDRLALELEGPLPATGHPVTIYFGDFVTPPELGTVGVLVEVPRAAAVGAVPGDPLVLREDMNASRFGLPFDVNGDGVIDDQPHDDDYKALPVIVRFFWAAPGDAPQVLTVHTYLRGIT